MTEYWKSTVRHEPRLIESHLTELVLQPKYWCKHCKTFVRDTPLEKNNHEATFKHQGMLKRFLRDLHRGNEQDERDKERAKREVARLNGTDAATDARYEVTSKAPALSASTLRNATPEERKRQIAQLAEMGVTVPEGFRRENAMAGEWETISRRVTTERSRPEVKQEAEDNKAALSVGVRKRKVEGEDDEEQKATKKKPKNWGNDVRALPGDDDDLDALLGASSTVKPRVIKTEDAPHIKEEHSPERSAEAAVTAPEATDIKPETDDAADIGSMFKRRKAKAKT